MIELLVIAESGSGDDAFIIRLRDVWQKQWNVDVHSDGYMCSLYGELQQLVHAKQSQQSPTQVVQCLLLSVFPDLASNSVSCVLKTVVVCAGVMTLDCAYSDTVGSESTCVIGSTSATAQRCSMFSQMVHSSCQVLSRR